MDYNFIETSVPVPIEKLKEHFEKKNTFYLIDYTKSELKTDKFLTYLSNLELPCDVQKIDSELITTYMNSKVLVNIPSLETAAINMLLYKRGIIEENIWGGTYEKNLDILEQWEDKLESLRLFNMSCIQVDEYKDFAKGHEHNDTDDLTGVNFVSLLKHEDFYKFYDKEIKKVKWYSKYFEDYMFRGKNMFTFWSTPKNPMYMLTWAIANGEGKNYLNAVKNELERMPHASPV